MSVTEILKTMVKVLTVGGEGRLSGAESSEHGQSEIKKWEHQNGERENHRQKRRHEIRLGNEDRVQLTGYRNR
jgi:hypothetical protein